MKYKVDDIVVCVYNDNGSQECIGEVFKVSEIRKSDKYPYAINNGKGTAFSEEEIRKVEVGDYIEWPTCSTSRWKITAIRSISDISCECVDPNGDTKYRVGSTHSGWNMNSARVTKANNSKPNYMKKLSAMMKKLLDADTQKLVKAGLINGDLDLTSEGQKALMTVLFIEHKAELVKYAEEVIAEAEKAEQTS